MPIENGMNSAYVELFSLDEYVNKIKLLPFVLEHLEYTNSEFDDYMKSLSKYDKEYISDYFINSLYLELESSQAIENHIFDISLIKEESLLFNTLSINHKRVHDIHNFAIKKEIEEGLFNKVDSYRKSEVNVSRYNLITKEEDIFWRGVPSKDLTKYMNDFIKIYRQSGLSLLYSNPFLFSSLIHLLFVRIHPYIDGNGRTARILHNLKFTEMINKLYGTRLKISPLNISINILLNKQTYVNRLNDIYFDIKHDTNYDINKWFDFILYMADEQIYYAKNQLGKVNEIHLIDKEIKKSTNQYFDSMRLSRIKKIH